MIKLNEKGIIKIFQSKFRNKECIPEDVEFFRVGKNIIVIKVDTLVESTDIPAGTELHDIMRKSIVSCISDFAAKCVIPKYGIISLTIPRKFSKLQITKLATAINDTANEFKIKMLGGDTNEGKELVIGICLIGITKKIIKRKSSKINDVIIATGAFGYTSAGLHIIFKKLKEPSDFAKKAKNSLLKPMPRLKFCMANAKYFSSAMDSSDGLSTTLHAMSTQAKKKFIITKLPTNKDVINFANKNNLDLIKLIFDGGEEYEVIATVNLSDLPKIKKNAIAHKIELFEIGHVVKGRGVVYNDIIIKDNGWMHFN